MGTLVAAAILVVAVVTLVGVEEGEETYTVEGVTEVVAVVVAAGAAATHTLIKEGSRTNSRTNSRTAVR